MFCYLLLAYFDQQMCALEVIIMSNSALKLCYGKLTVIGLMFTKNHTKLSQQLEEGGKQKNMDRALINQAM